MSVNQNFFESVIAAGAILTGFCGTFLAFRIQREAAYYRQPALDFETGRAKDIEIGLTHFTPALLLLLVATAASLISGFVLPLLAIAGIHNRLIAPPVVVAGLLGAVTLLLGYFVAELLHYDVLNRLHNDAHEWKKQAPVWITALLLAILVVWFAVMNL